jgi:MOSC domain-containing protein YiiM
MSNLRSYRSDLTVSGVIQTEECVGDMFRMGEATVQASQPRVPRARLTERGAGSRNLVSSHVRR